MIHHLSDCYHRTDSTDPGSGNSNPPRCIDTTVDHTAGGPGGVASQARSAATHAAMPLGVGGRAHERAEQARAAQASSDDGRQQKPPPGSLAEIPGRAGRSYLIRSDTSLPAPVARRQAGWELGWERRTHRRPGQAHTGTAQPLCRLPPFTRHGRRAPPLPGRPPGASTSAPCRSRAGAVSARRRAAGDGRTPRGRVTSLSSPRARAPGPPAGRPGWPQVRPHNYAPDPSVQRTGEPAAPGLLASRTGPCACTRRCPGLSRWLLGTRPRRRRYRMQWSPAVAGEREPRCRRWGASVLRHRFCRSGGARVRLERAGVLPGSIFCPEDSDGSARRRRGVFVAGTRAN